jgi:drug/metabolite transporter (DMT)-like permease
MPPFTGVALRFSIASVALLLVGFLTRVPLGRTSRERWLWLVNATLTFSISYGVVYWSEQWVPSGLTAVLFATYPLFVAVLAHFILPSERLTPKAAAGILLGFAGAAVIYSEDLALLGGPRVGLASAVVLVSPLVSAVASVAVKRWGQGIHPISLTAVPMGITGVVMGGVAAATERGRPVVWNGASVGALLYLAFFGSAVTFSLYYWLLSHVRATRLSLVAYTIPVVAVGVGIVFMGESLTGRVQIGSALVLAGVALAVHSPRRPPPPEGVP